ncbi:hypothetical protein [Nocardia terpenica]|uniref:hypothetical protein n=1 Tax=Nocardia terpenica TaxID=455432 RepID=UPI001EEAD2D7|nr:hypothetical protein [Nocardia terpenica]
MQSRRFFNHPTARPLVPYSEGEWSRLIATCRTVVDDAFAAQQAALAAAERARDPARGAGAGTTAGGCSRGAVRCR